MILIIESSGKNCSVALAHNQQLLFFKEELSKEGYIHTEKLHGFIQDALGQCNPQSELKAIAVSAGPGSYTGLRYGVSAAKALCEAYSIPLISVNPLKAMLHMLAAQTKLSECNRAMMDARRNEVFVQDFNQQGEAVSEIKAEIIEDKNYPDGLWFGDGADKLPALNLLPNNIDYQSGIVPSARYHVKEATEKMEAANFEDVAYFVPFYLKDFVATKAKQKFSIKGITKPHKG